MNMINMEEIPLLIEEKKKLGGLHPPSGTSTSQVKDMVDVTTRIKV
jgi:hypothetical protein